MRSGPKEKPSAIIEQSMLVRASRLPVDLLTTVPTPPAWCAKPDRDLWRSTCQTLIRRQHLTKGDLMAVEGLVLAWSNVRLAREQQDLAKSNRFLITAKTFMRELGLTPGSRDRVPLTAGMLQPVDSLADDLERFKLSAGDDATIPMQRKGTAS